VAIGALSVPTTHTSVEHEHVEVHVDGERAGIAEID
jgi:hypothetical protein